MGHKIGFPEPAAVPAWAARRPRSGFRAHPPTQTAALVPGTCIIHTYTYIIIYFLSFLPPIHKRTGKDSDGQERTRKGRK